MDLVVRAPRLPRPGETLAGHAFSTVPGGKGGNQAVAAARLGASVALIGCVGMDENGASLRAGLEAEGIDCSGVDTSTDEPSGVAMVIVDDASQNAIVIVAGSNGEVSPESVVRHEAAFAASKIVVCQMEVPAAAVEATLFTARRLGKPVLFNPAPVTGPLPAAWLASVDYLVANEIEAATLSGIAVESVDDARRAADALHDAGVRHVILTLGSRGVLARFDGGECEFLAAQRVDAVDTTAAGDTFVGAFAAAVAAGRSRADALAFGQSAAALSVTRPGAQPSIPYLRELSV
jgi:ribokinase